MKIQLLPSTIEPDGSASVRQHLACLIVDDTVAIDAGCLAQSATPYQRENVRDVVLTHAHLDHIAGLPLFVDDLFATVERPIRVHAIDEVIEVLERDIFNWSVYPRFSELHNDNGPVLEYRRLSCGIDVAVRHLHLRPLSVNHNVPSVGFIIRDARSTVVLTGDTAEMDGFWTEVNEIENVDCVIVECAFPNELSELAAISHHLTAEGLGSELRKIRHECPVYVMSIKPAYFDTVKNELENLNDSRLRIFGSGDVIEI